MTGAEVEPGAQAKPENKTANEVGVAEGEGEVPLVVRPKVRTQIMTGTRPKMKSRGMPGARSKSEPSTVDGTHTNYKTKAISSSRSKNDSQAWAQSKFWTESKSKIGEESQSSAANCPLVGADCGLVAKANCPSGGRELVNVDTKSFSKKKANSQVGFQPSCELEEATNIRSWCSSTRPIPKEEAYQTSDFKWVDKPFGNAWFSSRDEGSRRFHPRKSMKARTRSRHMAKPEANPMSKHNDNQEFYMISSSESDDECNNTSWFWDKEQSNPWSRSREEASNRSWFRPNREVYVESSSGSDYENTLKPWFWPGEEARARSKSRARKGSSNKARYQAKPENCTVFMPGSNDTVKKESWFWPEEKDSALLRHMDKKETRSREIAKEESKTKARARAKQEARSEEEALIGSWFWATEESSMVDGVSTKSNPHVEDEPIVGNWFWTEEEANVGTGTSHKSRPRAKEEQVNFSLETEKNNNMEIGAKAASKPMVAANDDEIFVGSWFWSSEEVHPENEEENVFGYWFWGIDDPSGRSAGRVSCESTARSEEKDVTNSWFWPREVDTETEVEEQTRSGSEEGSVFLSWFWSEKQSHVNSGAEASCDIRTGNEEDEPIIGPWFWGRVDAGVEAELNSKSSLVDEEEPIMSSWFGTGEETSMKCGVGARSKLMAEAEDTDEQSCFWAQEEPCVYPPNRETLKSALEEEDSVDSWFWSKNYTKPETVAGSWLWAAEQGNIDDETGEEIKLPTVEENILKFWKENEKAIPEPTDREESGPEAEEEDIIGPWFWAGEEDRPEGPAETREQSKIGAEDEATLGSWLWTEEAGTETESQALEEMKSETEEEEAIFASWFWAGKENTEAGLCCESTTKDDEEMIVESWLWSDDKSTEEPETGATCESRLENEERPVELGSRATDEENSKTDNGANCENSTESETIVGSWFWEGDETHFESNPSPVFRAICKSSSGEQDPDPSCRPQSWDEVTVKFKPGPWGQLGFPSISPFRFPKAAASLFSDMFLGKPKHGKRNLRGKQKSKYQPEPEFPFQYDPSYRSVQEIREHLKAKERAKPEKWSCKCIQCDLRIGSEEFEELLILMDRIRDPFVHEISKIAMGMRGASPFTRDFIRDSGVVSLIEALVDYPSSRDRTSFLEDVVDVTPPYPELNIIQTYVCRVCEDTIIQSLDSYEQLSGLTMIRHFTTATDYHTLVANYMSGYLTLLVKGNAKTRYHVLKVLQNLSENLAMTKQLLDADVMSEFMGLCKRKDTYDNLEVVLEIFENIGKNIEKEAFFADDDIDVEPLISTFRNVEKCAKELLSKTEHQNFLVATEDDDFD